MVKKRVLKKRKDGVRQHYWKGRKIRRKRYMSVTKKQMARRKPPIDMLLLDRNPRTEGFGMPSSKRSGTTAALTKDLRDKIFAAHDELRYWKRVYRSTWETKDEELRKIAADKITQVEKYIAKLEDEYETAKRLARAVR